MEYRLMTTGDYDSVLALWEDTEGVGLRPDADSREGIAFYLARNPATCFVAEEAGAVVGTVLGGHDGRRGYLYHLAVSARHRGKGIGRGLVDRAAEALQAAGIHKIGIVVFSGNDSGNRFWQHMGFAGRTDLVYRDKSLDENNT